MAFSYYSPFTVQSGQVPSTQTDFPVLLLPTDNRFRTVGNGGHVQNSNGYDLRPYADAGLTSPLTYELVLNSYNASSGFFEMWVKIPSLTTSTVIYLAYGDSGVSTDGSSTSTWNSNYKLVQHYSGTAPDMFDSTSNGNNGAPVGSPTAGVGKIGVAAVTSLGAASARNYIDSGTGTGLDPGSGDFTVGFWVLKQQSSIAFSNIWGIAKWQTGGSPGANEYSLGVSVTGFDNKPTIAVEAGSSIYEVDSPTDMIIDDWYRVLGVRSGTSLMLYVNGAQSGSTTTMPGGTTINNPGRNFKIGDSDIISAALTLNGYVDEVIYMSIAASADWLATEYNNQNDPNGTFYVLGAEQTPGGGGSALKRYSSLSGLGSSGPFFHDPTGGP